MSRRTLGTTVGLGLAVGVLGVSVAQATSAGADEARLRGPFLGTYTASLTAARASSLGDARMAGRFRLALRANGTYTSSNPLDGASSGRLAALPGRRLRFFADQGCAAGGFERPGGGIYRWSVTGTNLTLRLVNEGPCTGRTQSLTWVVWKRR